MEQVATCSLNSRKQIQLSITLFSIQEFKQNFLWMVIMFFLNRMVSLANSRQLSSTLIDFVHKLIGLIRRKKTWIQKLSFLFGTDKWKPNYNSRSHTNSCLSNRSHQVLTSFNQKQDESKQFSYKLLSISTLISFILDLWATRRIKNIQL